MMIKLEEIMIEKKELLNKYLKTGAVEYLTFTNEFLWRKIKNTKYSILYGTVCFIYRYEQGNTLISFPIGKLDYLEEIIEEILRYFRAIEETPKILLLNSKTANLLEEIFPGRFIITEDLNRSEYIYKIDDLIKLSGIKYHQKKNHINKFKHLYDYQYRKITSENIYDCKKVFDEWYNNKLTSDSFSEDTKETIYELFDNFNVLDIIGGSIYVDGKMVAFSFGEKKSHDTVIIYYEHADINYEGSFQVINQQFLAHAWSSYTYVNRECDLGIPGLRKAKLSYHPICMLKKYIATLPEPSSGKRIEMS